MARLPRYLARRSKDLYEIAEEVRRVDFPSQEIYFEEGPAHSIWFDTYPAKLSVMPFRHGRRLKPNEPIADATKFSVAFSWEDADVDMGEYKSARSAVRHAMELSLWSEDDIREAFL